MQPEADRRRLLRLEVLLGEALAEHDWARLGELDTLIAQSLGRLQAAGALTPAVKAQLAPLKRLHGQALGACAEECQRLKAILGRHTEFGEARQAYSLGAFAQAER